MNLIWVYLLRQEWVSLLEPIKYRWCWRDERARGGQSKDGVEKERGKMWTVGSFFSPFLSLLHTLWWWESRGGRDIHHVQLSVPACVLGCMFVCKKRERKPTFQADTESSSLEINSPQLFWSFFCWFDTDQIKNPLAVQQIVLVPTDH